MAVKNFRIGNDLVVLWAICNRDGSPYNLANKQVRLFVMNERGRKEVVPVLTTLPDGSINNVIRWDFYGMEQRVMGLYTLSVEIFTDEDKKSIKKDYCEAFCLVGSSSLEDEDLADNISDGGELILSSSLDVIQLAIPRIEIGVNGNWIINGIDSGISALGGGPGLVNKIYDVLGFGKEYDPTSVIDTFNAYAINSLYGSIKDAEKDIQDAQSSISTLEEDVEYLKTFGGGSSGGSSGGGSISQEQLTAIMEAIGKKADKATTLEGYGIANAYNKAYIDSTLNKYILLSASHQTIKGDITIDGNLIVKGEMASAGVSTDVGGGGSSTLAGLTDVLLGTLNNNDLLSWNGTVWTNVSRSSLTPNLDGYATKTYVTNALTPYATKDNVTSALGGYLPLSGGTLSGDISIVDVNGESTLSLGTKGSVYYNESDEETALYNNGSGFPSLKIKAGIAHPIFRYNYANYDVLHSGNIGDYAITSSGEQSISGKKTIFEQYTDKWSIGGDVYNLTISRSGGWAGTLAYIANTYGGSTAKATISAYGDSGTINYMYLGLSNDYNGSNFRIYSDKVAFGDHTLIHSGNIGSQSVNYAARTGSLNENEILDFTSQGSNRINGWNNWGNPTGTSFATYTHGIVACSPDVNVCHFIGFGNDDATPFIRSISYGNDSGWKSVALTDSTVAAATRLVTSSGAYMIHLTDYTLYIGDSVYLTRSTNLFGKEIALRYGAGATNGLVLNQSGNVLIGTTTDNGAKLQVEGNIIAKNSLSLYESDNIYFHLSQTPWYATIQSTHIGTAYLPIAINGNGGNVGIGTYNPQASLHVVGDTIITGDLATGSDIRFKDIINNTSLDIKDIANAPLFTFKWNDREDNNTHLGTSAQYWESISPELVTGEEFKTLNYASLGVAMGISLAKKALGHEERIKVLEEKVNELETENRRLRYGN